MVADPQIAPARTSLWRNRDYAKIWSAATVSLVGTQVTLLAIPVTAYVILHCTEFEFGLLSVLERLPFVLLTLPAGAWVDRLRRRPILIAADIGRGLTLLSVPAAYALGSLTMAQLYVVALAVGSLTVFFDVADQSFLPSVVSRDDLVEANAKLQISEAGAMIAGPSVASLLIDLLRAPFAIVTDALSYFGSALLVMFVRVREVRPARARDAAGSHMTLRQEIGEGLRYVLGNRYLRSIAASTGTSNFFSSASGAILVYYFLHNLQITVLQLGLIGTIGNVGILLAAFIAGRVPRWIGVGPTIVLAMFLGAPAALLIPIASHDTAFPLLVASGFLFSLSAVVYNVNQVSLRQAITPDRLLGRMNATMRFIVWGTIPIGGLFGTFLASSSVGIANTIWIAAIGQFVAFLPLLLSPVRSLRTIPRGEEGAASELAADGEAVARGTGLEVEDAAAREEMLRDGIEDR